MLVPVLMSDGPLELRTLRLADGRTMAYRDLGVRHGFPVLSCHGGLLDGRDIEPADEVARALGLRLLSPDRPGIGGSDRCSGRALLDWTDDVAQLADALRLDRVSVLGWSLGGIYAAACGFALPERVVRVALVAGCVPLDDPAAFAELNGMDRAITALALKAPRALGALARASSRVVAGAAALEELAWRVGVALPERMPDELGRAVAAGLARPSGLVDDYRVLVAPWGFSPEQIEVAVDVWQGGADRFVPPVWGERLARRIPKATLRMVEGAGHFLAYSRYREILGPLRP